LNANAFYYDYSNPQINTIIMGTIFVYNADSAETKGLELDAELRPTSRLSVTLGASYLDAKYGNFPSAALTIPRTPTFPPPPPPIPNGGNIVVRGPCFGYGGAAGNPCDATGHKIQNTPPFTLNAGIAYRIPSRIGDFMLGANWYHNGGFYPDPDNRLHVSSFDVINASVKWTAPDDRYDFQVWAKNLADAVYPYQAFSPDGGDAFVYAPPRTFGVTAGIHF
jgi:iron complex outermembrane receptor protein